MRCSSPRQFHTPSSATQHSPAVTAASPFRMPSVSIAARSGPRCERRPAGARRASSGPDGCLVLPFVPLPSSRGVSGRYSYIATRPSTAVQRKKQSRAGSVATSRSPLARAASAYRPRHTWLPVRDFRRDRDAANKRRVILEDGKAEARGIARGPDLFAQGGGGSSRLALLGFMLSIDALNFHPVGPETQLPSTVSPASGCTSTLRASPSTLREAATRTAPELPGLRRRIHGSSDMCRLVRLRGRCMTV